MTGGRRGRAAKPTVQLGQNLAKEPAKAPEPATAAAGGKSRARGKQDRESRSSGAQR